MDEEQKKTDEKYRKRKKCLIIIAISILLLAILAIICVSVSEKKNEGKILAENSPNQESNGLEKTEQEQNTDAGSVPYGPRPSEVIPWENVIVIIRNPEYPVPEEYLFERGEIIRDYLNGCKELGSLNDKVNCMDEYFINNVPHLKPMKESCADGDRLCLDEYYLEASNYGESEYCDIISTEELKEDCNGGE